MQSALEARKVLRWLIIVRWISVIDLVLLIVLLIASFNNDEELVRIFGLTHGIVCVALIAIVRHFNYDRPPRRFGGGSPNRP